MKTITNVLLTAALLLAAPAWAAGFALESHGGRAIGMSTAVTALGDDPSAVFYNPAGLLGGQGLELQLGAALIIPRVSFTSPAGDVSRVSGLSPPPHLYARYQIMDRVAAGLGVFVPFGASSSWPEGWEGRYRTTGSTLNVWNINPEVAVQVHDRVRLGAGVQILRGTVLLSRALGFVDSDGEVELGGGAWGTSFNVGTEVELVKDMLTFGASYRPGPRLDFEGEAGFTGVPAEFQSRLRGMGVSTSVDLPDAVFAGFGFRALEDRLRIGLDAHWYDWSSFQELRLNFEDEALSTVSPKRWTDTVSFHLGGEYRVTRALSARLGASWDPTPSPQDTLTPDLPDADRLRASVGVGYRLGDFQIDAAYQFVTLIDLESTSPVFPGTYGGNAHVVGLTLGWKTPF